MRYFWTAFLSFSLLMMGYDVFERQRGARRAPTQDSGGVHSQEDGTGFPPPPPHP